MFVITVRSLDRESLCSKRTIWVQKSGVIFVCYSREFVITMIVITEFDCIYLIIFIIYAKPFIL